MDVEKIKILYLEDDDVIGDVISEYLKMYGFSVDLCVDGNSAIDRFESDKYDFVILDIMVPGMSGMEVLEYIRKKNPRVGIIMLSALGDEKTQIQSFSNMADDYIIKPASPILLIKRINTIMRRTKLYDSLQMNGKKQENFCQNMKKNTENENEDSRDKCDIFKHLKNDMAGDKSVIDRDLVNQNEQIIINFHNDDGVFIDHDAYKVYENGTDINLTLTEFLIVDALNQNKRKAFTRNELLDKVYGEDYFGSDRVIDTHVKNIRKKSHKNFIKTVVGIGYGWNGEEVGYED